MSFAYKKIPQSNINILTNKVNKFYQFDTFINDNIDIFVGENIPASIINPFQEQVYGIETLSTINQFDPENDSKTTNNEYRRLIFDSIRHLFYNDFIGNSGSLISPSGSRYEYYPQTDLHSGSYSSTFRLLNNITGSSYQTIFNDYNTYVIYDDIFLYDDAAYDNSKGNLIAVISINKNIYGNKIKRNSIKFTESGSYIRDDGYGNLFNYGDEDTYNTFLKDGLIVGDLVGNILYSHGLLIITNPSYLCLFDIPPVAVNDSYTYLNTEVPEYLDIYANDYADCNNLIYSGSTLTPISGESFPDSYLDSNYLYLINNQTRYIPGTYKINYNVINVEGLPSNDALVILRITQNELQLNNSVDLVCSGSSPNGTFTASISGGTPLYSYSFDNINYYPISGFTNVEISSEYNITSSFLYIKDYLGSIVSSSLYPYFTYDYEIIITDGIYCNGTGSLILSSSESFTFTLNSDPTEYNNNTLYNIETGSYNMYISTSNGCIITESFNINLGDPLSINVKVTNVNCFGDDTGIVTIYPISGGVPPYDIIFNSQSYNDVYNNTTIIIEDLISGSYPLSVIDSNGCEYTSSILVTAHSELSMSINNLYNNPCYTTIEMSGSGGGSGEYIYTVIGPNGVYLSTGSIIPLTLEVNQMSSYVITASLEDGLGCSYTTYHTIPGRVWEYSGSYCENI